MTLRTKSILFSAFILLMFASCVKHDEIEFEGTVIGARTCNAYGLDQNGGYMIHITNPDNIGGTLYTSDDSIKNVVVLYEPPRRIMVDDNVKGSFYFDNDYSKTNCGVHYTEMPLPEGIFTSVSVTD